MPKKIFFFIFFFVFFFSFTLKAYGVSVTINDLPASIGTEPFTLSVSVTGASAGTNYLRVDIYKDGTTNYFGETFTGNDWYKGSNGVQYFPIIVPNDNPFTLQARVGDSIPSDYDGTGNYKLRVRRYTAGGNYNNDEAKANAVPIVLSFPTPTATPTNIPTPTKIPTPTRSASSGQAKAPTPTKVPTPTPLRSATQNYEGQAPTKTTVLGTKQIEKKVVEKKASAAAYPTVVLSASISASKEPQKPQNKNVLVKESNNNTALITSVFIVAAIFFIACGILVYRRVKHAKDTND